MDASPSYFDPENLSSREQYRRYRKRQPTSSISPLLGNSVSKFSEARLLYEGNNIQRRQNAALLLEEIKQEVDNFDGDGPEGIASKAAGSAKRLATADGYAASGGLESGRTMANQSLKLCKLEEDVLADGGESTFSLFASLLDSALQGLMPIPDLILRFENTCRTVSESIRYGTTGRHRVVEDRFMQQTARLLLDEAASWSLLWYLFGKANEEITEDMILSPTTSHQEACQFVSTDHTAQLCLRVVLWLEGLASETLELEKKVRGSRVGSYLPSSGVWHHTQRFLKKKNDDPAIVRHVDFDAPTREFAHQLSDDKKQDELLLEDIWTLLRSGRLEEACELCRSAGQPWRAASLCPFGGFDHFPTIEAMHKNGKSRTLQAIELESGIGRQWRLWKWASYCTSEKIAEQDGGKYEMAVYAAQCSNLKRLLPICTDWESACWAMAKSWLDVQVDLELANFHPSRLENKHYGDDVNGSSVLGGRTSLPSAGPECWPAHVLDQQPRDISALLQKLHSDEIVHETVSRACKEQHRQIEMKLMVGDIAHLLDLLWSWISPSEDDENFIRPHGDPQMIRFGAHVVLVLRYLLDDDVKDAFREKLTTVGDLILHMYSMFLFSKQHEELVGVYASQLARHLCIDLFVHMMELRLNDSLHVKYKLFLSAMEYLPFSSGNESKASFEDIIERVLARSREIKVGKYEKSTDVAEQHRLQSLQKATVVQWLCFTPPSTINDFEIINAKLLMRALMHSNTLFREFALISLWRVPKMPIGAHMLLSFLAEPLKQPKDSLLSLNEQDVSDNLLEFEDWREFYSCDATYRNWLKIELENATVPAGELSFEERDRSTAAARETLNSSFSLLSRDGSPWLSAVHSSLYDSIEQSYLELHATAMLCLPSGECMCPDATLCTALTSALYSSVSEEVVLRRQLMVNVAISSRDNYCIEVALRCLAIDGDGLGLHEANDGGVLAFIMAAGFKGELNRFQTGVTMEISRLDAWYSDAGGSLEIPATYIVRGLCRRCCLPEIILRCMQVSVSLAESGDAFDRRNELIELVASSDSGLLQLFSQQQLQEFLLFERECTLFKMELQEELFMSDV
ncbi:nuclear pore complex protein NUP107 [Dioscorea cayenensis subsp. rotundata]|uniref:Nuclear pore complex protein n=1 Tax=Dioscorea cayennensis subsp. rotundata TaxID=55577 RepID=A0AB40BIM8_DIOCR|nr:nuclear pore complex protein NUP107 [Dioscorea cayenensis subsp. rotundata]